MIRNVFFDLDGTLTDPREGIGNGLRRAFALYGLEVGERGYGEFIGPVLRDYLPRRFPGLGEETYDAIVGEYRAYYSKIGKFENEPYPGVMDMLIKLRSAGLRLAVATSKPKVFADQIFEHFGMSEYLDHIAGPGLRHADSDKSGLIRECLAALGSAPEEAIMVGDREFDIDGARVCGVKSVAALYGYGTAQELAGADYAAVSPVSLTELLLELAKGL